MSATTHVTTRSTTILSVGGGLLLIAYFALAPTSPRAITGIAGLIAVLGAIVGWHGLNRLPPSARGLFAAFVLYVAVALISLLNNENWHLAGVRFEKYHPFLFAIPVMGGLALMRDTLERILLTGMMASGATITTIAAYEKLVLHAERVGYFSGLGPNIFGHVASLVALTLCGYLLLAHLPRTLRALVALLTLGTLFSLLTTGTRGAVVAFLFGFAALTITWLLRDGISRKRLLILTGSSIALAGLLTATFLLSDFWRAHWERLIEEPARFFAGDTTYTSTAAHLTLWISGLKTGLANFWIGTGIGDNQLDYDRLMAAGELPAIPDNSNFHLHNIFIDAFASTGIIGLCSMLLAVFIMPMRQFINGLRSIQATRQQQMAAIIGIAILANGFIFGMTYSWLYIRGLHFYLLLLLSLLVLAQTRETSSS